MLSVAILAQRSPWASGAAPRVRDQEDLSTDRVPFPALQRMPVGVDVGVDDGDPIKFNTKDLSRLIAQQLQSEPVMQRERNLALAAIQILRTRNESKERVKAVRGIEAVDVSYMLDDIQTLFDGLTDAEAEVRWRCAHKIAQVGRRLTAKQVGQIVAHADDPSAEVRSQVIRALASSGKPASAYVQLFLESLRDTNWQVRISAAHALSSVNRSAVTPFADEIALCAFKDSDMTVRRALAELLAGIKSWETHSFTDGETPRTSVGKVDINAAIDEMLETDDFCARILACQALRLLSPDSEDSRMKVASLLRDRRVEVVTQAARALSVLGCPNDMDVSHIEDMLANPATWMRCLGLRVVSAMSKSQSEGFAPKVARLCNSDPDSDVRAVSVGTLSRLGKAGEAYVSAIVQATIDEDLEVRDIAGGCLKTMGSVSAANILHSLMTPDVKGEHRMATMRALTMVQSQPTEVICAFLCEWAQSPDLPLPIRGLTEKHSSDMCPFGYHTLVDQKGNSFVVFDTDVEPMEWMSMFQHGFLGKDVQGHMLCGPKDVWHGMLKSIASAVWQCSKEAHANIETLFITGHGKGGMAAAAMASCLYNERLELGEKCKLNFNDLRVVTFAAPGIVTSNGDEALATLACVAMEKLKDWPEASTVKAFHIDGDPIQALLSPKNPEMVRYYKQQEGWFTSSPYLTKVKSFLGSEAHLAEYFTSILPEIRLPHSSALLLGETDDHEADEIWYDERMHEMRRHTAAVCKELMKNRAKGIHSMFDTLIKDSRKILPEVFSAWREAAYELRSGRGSIQS